MREITKHIVHCSDSQTGDVKTIRQWHKEKGWQDVGYHFIIRPDGEVEIGRPLHQVGAHTQGHNQHSVGTCLVGKNTFTVAQFEALKKIQAMLEALFGSIPAFGHNHFNPHKTCPNFNVADVLAGNIVKGTEK